MLMLMFGVMLWTLNNLSLTVIRVHTIYNFMHHFLMIMSKEICNHSYLCITVARSQARLLGVMWLKTHSQVKQLTWIQASVLMSLETLMSLVIIWMAGQYGARWCNAIWCHCASWYYNLPMDMNGYGCGRWWWQYPKRTSTLISCSRRYHIAWDL